MEKKIMILALAIAAMFAFCAFAIAEESDASDPVNSLTDDTEYTFTDIDINTTETSAGKTYAGTGNLKYIENKKGDDGTIIITLTNTSAANVAVKVTKDNTALYTIPMINATSIEIDGVIEAGVYKVEVLPYGVKDTSGNEQVQRVDATFNFTLQKDTFKLSFVSVIDQTSLNQYPHQTNAPTNNDIDAAVGKALTVTDKKLNYWAKEASSATAFAGNPYSTCEAYNYEITKWYYDEEMTHEIGTTELYPTSDMTIYIKNTPALNTFKVSAAALDSGSTGMAKDITDVSSGFNGIPYGTAISVNANGTITISTSTTKKITFTAEKDKGGIDNNVFNKWTVAFAASDGAGKTVSAADLPTTGTTVVGDMTFSLFMEQTLYAVTFANTAGGKLYASDGTTELSTFGYSVPKSTITTATKNDVSTYKAAVTTSGNNLDLGIITFKSADGADLTIKAIPSKDSQTTPASQYMFVKWQFREADDSVADITASSSLTKTVIIEPVFELRAISVTFASETDTSAIFTSSDTDNWSSTDKKLYVQYGAPVSFTYDGNNKGKITIGSATVTVTASDTDNFAFKEWKATVPASVIKDETITATFISSALVDLDLASVPGYWYIVKYQNDPNADTGTETFISKTSTDALKVLKDSWVEIVIGNDQSYVSTAALYSGSTATTMTEITATSESGSTPYKTTKDEVTTYHIKATADTLAKIVPTDAWAIVYDTGANALTYQGPYQFVKDKSIIVKVNGSTAKAYTMKVFTDNGFATEDNDAKVIALAAGIYRITDIDQDSWIRATAADADSKYDEFYATIDNSGSDNRTFSVTMRNITDDKAVNATGLTVTGTYMKTVGSKVKYGALSSLGATVSKVVDDKGNETNTISGANTSTAYVVTYSWSLSNHANCAVYALQATCEGMTSDWTIVNL